MSKASTTPKKRIYSFSGETVPQRKKQATDLLRRLGFSVDRKSVRQTKGMLYATWLPPFTKQDLQRLDRLGTYAVVIFIPEPIAPQLACVKALFEHEPGLHFAVPVLQQYHPIAAWSELESLLLWHSQLLQARQARIEEVRHHAEPEPPPHQQETLWGDEAERAEPHPSPELDLHS